MVEHNTPLADDVRGATIRAFSEAAYGTDAIPTRVDRFLREFEVRPRGTVTDTERQAVADAIDNTAVITPRNEFLGGSTIANILDVADAALEAAREARNA